MMTVERLVKSHLETAVDFMTLWNASKNIRYYRQPTSCLFFDPINSSFNRFNTSFCTFWFVNFLPIVQRQSWKQRSIICLICLDLCDHYPQMQTYIQPLFKSLHHKAIGSIAHCYCIKVPYLSIILGGSISLV